MSEHHQNPHCDGPCGTARRSVLLGATALAAVPVLAACSGSGSTANDPAAGPATPTAAPTPATEGSAAPTGPEIGDAADVPVGGYAVYSDAKVVVSQPTAGSFVGFSAVCTHQGCLVSPADRDGDPIVCKCHFSKFSLTDGAALEGPARSALPTVALAVQDGKIYRA